MIYMNTLSFSPNSRHGMERIYSKGAMGGKAIVDNTTRKHSARLSIYILLRDATSAESALVIAFQKGATVA